MADEIIYAASVSSEESVIEIGPGLGILTFKLAKYARWINAIELERQLVNYLKKEIKNKKIRNVNIRKCNALKMEFPEFQVMVSNLPYNISTPLLFKLLPLNFNRAILMFQREFGERLIAAPGTKARGIPTIKANYYADVRALFPVDKRNFFPVPNVDSMVVEIKKRGFPYQLEDRDFYFKLVEILFRQRRKKIRNSLALGYRMLPGTAKMKKNEFRELIGSIVEKDTLQLRAEDLEVPDFVDLANLLWNELEIGSQK